MNNNNENQEARCVKFSRNWGQKLMFLFIGGGIGAAAALIFAPKPGREIREDIVDLAEEGYDQVIAEANRVKHNTSELYQTALETGGEVLDAIQARATAIKKDVKSDINRIGTFAEDRSWGSRAIL
jgi:gas vesicle protein